MTLISNVAKVYHHLLALISAHIELADFQRIVCAVVRLRSLALNYMRGNKHFNNIFVTAKEKAEKVRVESQTRLYGKQRDNIVMTGIDVVQSHISVTQN